jgi:hypothetical protein
MMAAIVQGVTAYLVRSRVMSITRRCVGVSDIGTHRQVAGWESDNQVKCERW